MGRFILAQAITSSMHLMPGREKSCGLPSLEIKSGPLPQSPMGSFMWVRRMTSCTHLMLQQVHNCGLAALEIRFSPLPQCPLPSLEEQGVLVEQHGVDTLLFCPDAWALRHVFIN